MTQNNKQSEFDTVLEQEDQEIRRRVQRMFDEYHDRLLRMIDFRLHPEIRHHIDSNDILQDSFMEAYRQLREHVSEAKTSDFVWLRLIINQQLIMAYRRYCQTQKRSGREISIYQDRLVSSDSLSMSGFLVGKLTTPSVAARRQELILKLRECLDELPDNDRQILSLRHFEQLTNAETAEELNIAPNTASVRYLRALKRFRDILKAHKMDELL